VLFYATDDDTRDDDRAADPCRRLRPLKAGGLADAGRIEGPGGDLARRLERRLLDLDQARAPSRL
jgi:hypothetical protein